MRILEKNIPFARLVAANCDPHHYVKEQLIEANSEFGTWAYVALSKEDVLKVWLPAHGEAGLPEGSVAAAVAHFQESLHLFHPDCREKIARLVDNSCPVLLKESSKAALEHLDGLHRLIAWGVSARDLVMAYVAGKFA